jgi:hypothetical protein
MLVWINGPFGGGKTVTAYELSRRLPGSVGCNPEYVGFGMRRMLPAPLRGNFQDLPAWRRSVAELLELTLTRYDGPVIVPMTLLDLGYFQEIIGHLRHRGPEFAPHIPTGDLTVAQVADAVARSAGLAISPSTDGPLHAALRRYATTIRHIRFD